jgi:hypothetical protein
MVKKIIIAVAVLIGAFFGFVLVQPATYHVERTTTVEAPVDVVFPLLNDMKARAA